MAVGWSIKTIKVTVTTAGTAVPISATQLFTPAFEIVPDENNVGDIVVGGADVSTSNAEALGAAGKAVSAPAVRGSDNGIDLSTVYVDSSANSQAAYVTYFVRA